MDAHIHANAEGTILFDADTVPQIRHDWFDPAYWEARDAVRERAHGRAAAYFMDTPAGPCVLKHYHRGGMVANLLGDRYLWTGRDRTRCFAEFRLLARMRAADLPVPDPVAAHYRRTGAHYTADLITRRIEGARTLAQCLRAGELDASLAQACGALVARFHRHGIWHADLNAHNVLVTERGLALIDFDRGQQREPAATWQQANMRRLCRSLIKLGAARDGEPAFDRDIREPLMRAHARALEQD